MLPQHFGVSDSPLPAKPRVMNAEKIKKVCLMCGDKGVTKRLVYCIQCKACAQHSYCIEKIHRDDDGKIVWRCIDCAPSNPKCKPELFRKSERISHATEAKYKRIVMKKKSGAVGKQSLIRSNGGEGIGCHAKNDAEKILPILQNEDVLCTQPASHKAKDPLNMSSVRSKEGASVGCHAKNDAEKILPILKNEDVLCTQPASHRAKDPLYMSSVRSKEGVSVGCHAKNDAEKILPVLENENGLCNQPESPQAKDPLNMSSEYKRMIMKKKSGSDKKQSLVGLNEGESVGCHAKNDAEKILPVLKNEDVLCNHPESPEAKDPSNISCDKQAMKSDIYLEPEAINIKPQLLHYPEFDKYSRAQPLSDPIWGGQFRLNNATYFHIVAYLSSKAYSKVKSAATELPELLDVELLSRHVIWPQSFVTHPPDSDCIGLYFFPQYERDEMIFDSVLNNAIEKDNALKAVINNYLELFIYSSHLLPPDDRRICKKHYLWGAFKPKPRN
ncbi:uncharacterized protein LOC131661132 [Vicia villosa]|uniref:uncharacterized protein LOC131661132 n=1 Tax=Vicia villosa TaxID=3911 RepID=UPI00273CE18B|nr:uncharacterized protein LOC131661132 [Vicia villosa]